MKAQHSQTFHLGQFEVSPDNNTITYNDSVVHIEPQVMNVLHVLSRYKDAVAPRHELLDKAWPNEVGADESLTRSISQLRIAFKTLSADSKVIKTVHKKGYRLLLATTFPSILTGSTEDYAASIAVLPFSDLSHDNQNQHFAEGMSEEILNALSNVSGLRVMARTSAFAFNGREYDIDIVKSSLSVKYILEGSIRLADDRLRVSVKLMDLETGFHTWSESYNVEVTHVFDVQETIAQSISLALRVKLISKPIRLAHSLTRDPTAYNLFLQGRAVNQRIYTDGVLKTATNLLMQALDRDPDFAQAHLELARTLLRASIYVKRSQKQSKIDSAAERAQMALNKDPEQMGAIPILALQKYTQGDVVGAISITESAYHAQPHNPDIAHHLGCYFLAIGKVEASIPLLEKAVELDPVQGRLIQVLAIAKLSNKEFSEAETLAKRSMDMGYAYAIDTYAAVAYALGNHLLAKKRMMAVTETMLSSFGPTFSDRKIWETGFELFYSEDPEGVKKSVQLAVSLLESPEVIEENSSAELLLAMTLLRAGAAKELFRMIGPTPPPGSHAVFLNFWGEGEPYSKIYNHPEFMTFAERIGFTKAWRKYGWPDRLL